MSKDKKKAPGVTDKKKSSDYQNDKTSDNKIETTTGKKNKK